MTIETYSKHLISYIWYVRIDRREGQCIILQHGRLHYTDPMPPETIGTFNIVEGKGRVAEKVAILGRADPDGQVLEVVNPRHVFDYPGFDD